MAPRASLAMKLCVFELSLRGPLVLRLHGLPAQGRGWDAHVPSVPQPRRRRIRPRDRTTTEGIEPRQAIAAPGFRPLGRMHIVRENGAGLHYSAALMISSATSFGKESIATWLDGTSIAVALAAFTWSLSICGGMIVSFVATTMKVGFSRHATWLIGAVRVLMWNGPWVAATTVCSSGERSAAKYLLMPSSLIVR